MQKCPQCGQETGHAEGGLFWCSNTKCWFSGRIVEPDPKRVPMNYVRLDELRPGWPGFRRPPADLLPIVIDEV